MNFIINLLELNKYNIQYIVIDYNLIKTIVFILYIKTINVVRITNYIIVIYIKDLDFLIK